MVNSFVGTTKAKLSSRIFQSRGKGVPCTTETWAHASFISHFFETTARHTDCHPDQKWLSTLGKLHLSQCIQRFNSAYRGFLQTPTAHKVVLRCIRCQTHGRKPTTAGTFAVPINLLKFRRLWQVANIIQGIKTSCCPAYCHVTKSKTMWSHPITCKTWKNRNDAKERWIHSNYEDT